ncbi:MAG: ferritin-like domain-containing protein [Deltaproteobacteria bacterium]|nr:ferritin-like domain-containing protein [Deltaproteobacteria bacterium]
MKKNELISMLNRDITDEHAAIIRYLVHGYLEGEDTPLGAGLLSRAREEMWHMHWLGMIIGQLGGGPDMKPGPYPFDPTNRATIFKSYVEYEEKLIPHYKKEADMVDDPHIKRVLLREAWESAMHATKFQRVINKLNPEQASTPPGSKNELPMDFVDTLQDIVKAKYNEMLQHLRNAWVFQQEETVGWKIMDFAMTKMKQLAHDAEPIAENGIVPKFKVEKIDLSTSIGLALKKALEDVNSSRQHHETLRGSEEAQKHAGLMINLGLSIQQESYEAEEIEGWLSSQYIRDNE